MIFRLLVSDTSDGTHCVQTPNLARCFVGVSVSTITSFSWFLMETDTTTLRTARFFPFFPPRSASLANVFVFVFRNKKSSPTVIYCSVFLGPLRRNLSRQLSTLPIPKVWD